MGLFDKKFCAICGKQIGLFGSRKVDDGVICVECVRKLSPYFHERKKSTVAEIIEQIVYREKNAALLEDWTPTKVLGGKEKIYLNENTNEFCISSYSNWKSQNPDIINLSDVYNCEIILDEDEDEIYDKDEEGKQISYEPKRYEYKYDFKAKLSLNHKYFDEITIAITNEEAEMVFDKIFNHDADIAAEIYQLFTDKEFELDLSHVKGPIPREHDHLNLFHILFPNGLSDIISNINVTSNVDEEDDDVWYCTKCGQKNSGNFCSMCGNKKPEKKASYCPNCGEKITNKNARFCSKCGNKL